MLSCIMQSDVNKTELYSLGRERSRERATWRDSVTVSMNHPAEACSRMRRLLYFTVPVSLKGNNTTIWFIITASQFHPFMSTCSENRRCWIHSCAANKLLIAVIHCFTYRCRYRSFLKIRPHLSEMQRNTSTIQCSSV